MFVAKQTAPTYARLRPLRPTVTSGFPVYEDLAARLAAVHPHPDDTVAHVLAVLSGYAYSSADTVSMIMARLGLADNRCLMVSQQVDAMFIDATCFVVQSSDGRVVLLGYRGTRPTAAASWLTDLDVYPDRVAFDFPGGKGPFGVHAGFYRNVRAVRYEVVGALERALAGTSVLDGSPVDHPLEALYVTGHSLGGAMASLMTLMLVTDPAYATVAERLRACYTTGAPMVGDRALAEVADADPLLGPRTVRHVYRHDLVPHLPPTESGDFAHFGREYRYGETWPWTAADRPTQQLSNLAGLVEAPLAFVARQVRWLRDVPFQHSLADHGPQHYITALTPPGVPNEFGDSPYTTPH